MAKSRRTPEEFDSPWKDALHHYLPAFLAFFFPDIHADLEWKRGYEALDKEFQRIVRRAKLGKRLADKLFKVWRQDGSERWLLIHIEIQGDYEKEFPERMFDYHIAARQLYNQEVVSLAILCDDGPQWRPTIFAYENWACRIQLTFRIAKLLDWVDNDNALQTDDNPFAAIVRAHLGALRTRDKPEMRRILKLQLVKELYQRKLTKDDVRRLFFLIDWMMALPNEFENKFWEGVDEIEKETIVRYISSIERVGMEKGRQEGREEGLRQGLREGITLDLKEKFGAEGLKLARKMRVLDLEALRRLARLIKKAKSLDEVQASFE